MEKPTEGATSGQAQGDDIEVVVPDNPAPPAQTGVAGSTPPDAGTPILGKFKSLEDVPEAYKNLEKKFHERDSEIAALRREIEMARTGQQTAPTPAQPYNPDEVNQRFREQLEQDTFGTMANFVKMVASDIVQSQTKQQRDQYAKYYQLAQQPEFSDVAGDVAQVIPFATDPIDPIEGAFLRAKVLKYEQMMRGGQIQKQPAEVPFVEGSSANRSSAGIRVELDSDPRLKKFGGDKMKDLARMVAKQQIAGKQMDSFSIDDWEGLK